MSEKILLENHLEKVLTN